MDGYQPDLKQDDPWIRDHIRFITERQPKGTSSSYNIYWKQFVLFCQMNRRSFLPAEPSTVAMFMRALLVDRLSRATITKTALAAIAERHKLAGFPSPTSEAPGHALVSAMKKAITRATPPPVSKKPIFIHHFTKMMRVMNQDSLLDSRDMFTFIVMYLGLLRESEAINLRDDHVWFATTDQGVRVLCIWIQSSKTDQEQVGELVILEENLTDVRICPVAWFLRYKSMKAYHPSEWLLVSTTSLANKALKNSLPNDRLKIWMGKIGEQAQDWSSHSLRHGGATSAAAMGIGERLLKVHGRWRSNCVRVYIHDSLESRLSVSRAIAAYQGH